MPRAGFEPVIPASERPQSHTLDRAAIDTGFRILGYLYKEIYRVHFEWQP